MAFNHLNNVDSNPNWLGLMRDGTSNSYGSVGTRYALENIWKGIKDPGMFSEIMEYYWHRISVNSGRPHAQFANSDYLVMNDDAEFTWTQEREYEDITATGAAGDDFIIGNDRNNILIGDTRETMYAGGSFSTDEAAAWRSEGRDAIYGLAGNDKLFGGGNDDYLDGGNDNDQIWGGDNNDILVGGGGYDKMYGGLHDDLLIGGLDGGSYFGGKGRDTFYVQQTPGFGIHRIEDMKDDGDRLIVKQERTRDWGWRMGIDTTEITVVELFDLHTQMIFGELMLHNGAHYEFDSTGVQVFGRIDNQTSIHSIEGVNQDLSNNWNLI